MSAGADLKTAQELLRHANSRITLDIYTRAISETKRDANNKVMEMVRKRSKFPSGVVGASQVTLSVWDASGGLWKRSVGLSS